MQCGFADSAESIPARIREEEAAFAGTPHRRDYLRLLELQYAPQRPPDDRIAIQAAATDWLRRHPGATVALPAGAGCPQNRAARWRRRLLRRRCVPPQHVDHLYVRDAVLGVVDDSTRILLYEELPYLWGAPADKEAQRTAAGSDRKAAAVIVPIDRSRKARRIAAYASQVPPMSPEGRPLDDPRSLPDSERYWLLERR